MIEIYSEINELKSVILHRPGNELNNLTPAYLSEYLFEDIPYLQKAQEEHDQLRNILESNNVNVYLVTDLLIDIFSNNNVRKMKFLNDFFALSKILDSEYTSKLEDFFMNLSTEMFVDRIISGVKITEIYKMNGLEDNNFYGSQLFILPPMPNLLYQRDPAFTIGNTINLSTLSNNVRIRETFILKTIFSFHPLFQNNHQLNETNSFKIEGGDIQVLSKDIAIIGMSKRTEPLAIKTIARNILSNTSIKTIYGLEIPKNRAFMHLDTVFTQVDYDKFVYHQEIFKNVQAYRLELKNQNIEINYISGTLEGLLNKVTQSTNQFIPCGGMDFITSSREQWNDGANTFAIKPGKVITYDRNITTNELLSKSGVDIVPIKASELSRGRGGPHCLTLPLKRL